MVRFDAQKLADLRLLATRLGEMATPQDLADSAHGRALVKIIDQMLETIDGLVMPLSAISLQNAKRQIEAGESFPGNIKRELEDFTRRFRDELKGRVFFTLAAGSQAYWDPATPLFGQGVHDAFPSSRYEVAEAGKCFALGRYTACVMHLMRALEAPLKVQAANLGVVLPRDSWGLHLQKIEDAIDALRSSDPKKEFHSAAATQFTFIKNAWRDAAMHQRGTYEEDDASPIMAAVKGLMRHLAKELHE
jgi:hypothetical protein